MLGCFVPMHSCIDNCIHSFAGVQLRSECARQMSRLRAQYGPDYVQPTAVPMLTDGYNLPAKKVIHIVGPIVADTLTEQLERDLANCYKNTLDLCRENGLRSVAFCCISTGVFRFPAERAAETSMLLARAMEASFSRMSPARILRALFLLAVGAAQRMRDASRAALPVCSIRAFMSSSVMGNSVSRGR
jgi:O-acetyl-ADP-ribose deacetylase (regulator of RNase III)